MGQGIRIPPIRLSGLLLCGGALAMCIVAFFELPLYYSTVCFDSCDSSRSPIGPTAWVATQNLLANFNAPAAIIVNLTVVYAPLAAVAMLLVLGIILLGNPTRTLLRWSAAIWIADIAMLILLRILIFLVFSQPDLGYWGLGLSALLSGIGLLLMRAARP